jgi:hypothetical protein
MASEIAARQPPTITEAFEAAAVDAGAQLARGGIGGVPHSAFLGRVERVDVRRVVTRILEREGYQDEPTANGDDALAELRAEARST